MSFITDTLFVDSELPSSPGQGFFYLVAYIGVQGQQGLGRTSTGRQRTVASSCP